MCGPAAGAIFGAVSSIFGGRHGGGDQASTPAPVMTPAPVSPTVGVESIAAEEAAKKKAALMQGFQSTIMTGSQGVTGAATTTKKSLLGS